MATNNVNIRKFREEGFIQELNRQFLHPLGYALTVVQDGHVEFLGGIIDYSKDQEGIYYGISNMSNGMISTYFNKAKHVQLISEKIHHTREESIGYIVEPIPGIDDTKPDVIDDLSKYITDKLALLASDVPNLKTDHLSAERNIKTMFTNPALIEQLNEMLAIIESK